MNQFHCKTKEKYVALTTKSISEYKDRKRDPKLAKIESVLHNYKNGPLIP